MKFAVEIFPTDYGISMAELAPAVEERGFESLWVSEHSHIPVSRESPWPGGDELPRQYLHTLDPFVALTIAAAVTRTLRVGTGICLLIQRDTFQTAKSVASLDHASGGRLLFGVGGGWNREEMEDHGTAWTTRWKLLREKVEAMKRIWTEEQAAYDGELVRFGPAWAWPKPAQQPHPPILLGGNGPRTLERVVRYADGWMPLRGDVKSRVPELRRLAEEAGRGPIPVTCYGTPAGGPAEIEEAQALGVDRLIWWLPPDGRDPALRELDRLAALVRPYASTTAGSRVQPPPTSR